MWEQHRGVSYLCLCRFFRNFPFPEDSCHIPSTSSPRRTHTGQVCSASFDIVWTWTTLKSYFPQHAQSPWLRPLSSAYPSSGLPGELHHLVKVLRSKLIRRSSPAPSPSMRRRFRITSSKNERKLLDLIKQILGERWANGALLGVFRNITFKKYFEGKTDISGFLVYTLFAFLITIRHSTHYCKRLQLSTTTLLLFSLFFSSSSSSSSASSVSSSVANERLHEPTLPSTVFIHLFVNDRHLLVVRRSLRSLFFFFNNKLS